ncbi:MAG TPA: winged helix-turn-helix domain-containing protein [Bryobacteraceae bacterium]|jgi:TolB-like protein|nr:winged helix-turn-helix domain-containing protein [Bryobacteraceae bacterium]
MSNPQDNPSGKGVSRKLRFGAFEVDLDQQELRNRGIRVHLQRKPFQILELLLRRRGALVTRTELAQHLWPGLHVNFGRGLNTAINVLRQTLGDSSAGCRFIETRSGLGYRFLASVEEVPETDGEPPSDRSTDSIAILPFDNATGDPAMSAVVNHMAEDLIASLSTLEHVRVIAHTSALRYRMPENEPRSAGRELDVRAVLTGRIERRDQSLLLTAELVDVKTGRHLWGEQYEFTPDGVLDVEISISSAVIKRLNLPSAASEVSPIKKRYTSKVEAYQDYRKGKYLQNKLTEADLGKSIAHFESAIAADPSYALAYTGLADTYILLAFLGVLSATAARSRAEELTRTALQIDDELAEAHASLASIRKVFDRDYLAAEMEYHRALQLSPGSVDAHRAYAAFLSAMERPAEALEEIRNAQGADPLSLALNVEAARILYMGRSFEQCIQQAWQTLVLEATFAPAQHLLGLAYEQVEMYEEAIIELQNAQTCSAYEPEVLGALGHAYGRAGKAEEATDILAKLDGLSTRRYVSPYWRAILYAGLGAKDLALDELKKAFEEQDVWLVWLKVEPRFDPLRADRRFVQLLEAGGFNAEVLSPAHFVARSVG